ncbi:DUF3710 domain-containing protein [Gleimia hominis]|uniref:DUF3710 domain-containing protein n=1 Tax=Gleimia hominis TaxID=595468 RepID=UPI000C7FA5FB|nr:DUF3710 domain-containing protein [Gleimia hominis]WIK65147.1 DUF3710 domain-containing protein [Gleimia hominis]
MGFFRRKKHRPTHQQSHSAADANGLEEESAQRADSPAATEQSQQAGPRDISQVREISESHLDFGPILVPAIAGMQLQAIKGTGDENLITHLGVVLGASAVQLLVAAAPRSGGVWDNLRVEMSEQLKEQGVRVREIDGPWGTELQVKAPVRNEDGGVGTSISRVIGIEGPRWFLRVDVLGPAAYEEAAMREVEPLLNNLIVRRDDEPRPPMSILPLQLPKAQ